MIHSRTARTTRALSGAILFGAATLIAGCDNSTGTPPAVTDADIQKREADELAARQKAYGGRGVPTGRNPGKNAGKVAPAEKPGT